MASVRARVGFSCREASGWLGGGLAMFGLRQNVSLGPQGQMLRLFNLQRHAVC